MLILLVFASAADRRDFEYLYSRYKTVMLHKAFGILHDWMLAEDAVSEAFIRIYKNMDKIGDPESGRCAAFVLTIVKNTALTLWQRQRRQPMEDIDDVDSADPADLEDQVVAGLSSEAILALVGGLNEELRSVFLLKFAYDMSHRDIGRALGITENNVTVRLHRAKKKIAAMLEKEGYAGGRE